MCNTYSITGYDEPDHPFRLVKDGTYVVYESWVLANVWRYMREIAHSDYTCKFTDGKDTIPGPVWLAHMVCAGFIETL